MFNVSLVRTRLQVYTIGTFLLKFIYAWAFSRPRDKAISKFLYNIHNIYKLRIVVNLHGMRVVFLANFSGYAQTFKPF